jgi:DNA-binding IscR family transcriptional regulator
LNIPAEFGDKILSHLVDSGLIVKTSEPKVGFVPAKDPENIRLSDIADAVAKVGFAQSVTEQPAVLEQITRSQRSVLSEYNVKQILSSEQNS